jgi:ParB-like chromosome segregation protein Spo0J
MKNELTTPPIRCAHDALVALEKIQPNPRNPNTHPPDQIKALAKIITHQGWRSPLVVSNQSGFIVAGHGRYEAALILGVESVPVNFQDFENEADEWAHLIADNRLAELADMNESALADLLIELDTGAIDLTLTGFDENALARLVRNFPGDETDQPFTSHECPKCGHKWEPTRQT